MSNLWHSPTPDLIPGDIARAEDINDKLTAVDVAFDKLPEPHPTLKGFNEAIMIGEATDPGHATTKNFVETGMTSQVAQAAASASAAATSASSASTSASNAATSATSAGNSATAAAASQTAAAGSATSASTSATSAGTSATNASNSATAAAASQTAAASSASAASTSATNAATSATNASNSASAASTSATSAANSASAASTSATNAAASATSAGNSATSATASASTASTAETNASASAAAALASENKAEQWAEELEDVEVEPGKYSALHWAAKAQLGGAKFSVVTGNTGTATADDAADSIAITGADGITTAATAGASAALAISPTYGSTPVAIQAGDTQSGGVANTIARNDHRHAVSTAAPIANLTASTSNAAGSAATLARSDHSHAITTAAPAANLTAITTNALGSAASLARSDHSHAITTAAAVGLNADSANGAGSSTGLARADHTHSLSTGTPSGSLGANTANAPGVATSLARSDHAHALATGSPVALGSSISAGVSNNLARADHVHPYPTAANVGALDDPGSNGLIARTAANGVTTVRTITGPAAGITVSNGNGASGNPTLALAHDLAALEGLGSTGFAVRTGTNAWAQRTLTDTLNEIDIINGNGVAGNPQFRLATGVRRLIASGDINAADVSIDVDTNAYRRLFLVVKDWYHSTTNWAPYLRINDNAVDDSYWSITTNRGVSGGAGQHGSNNNDVIRMTAGITCDGESFNKFHAEVVFENPNDTVDRKAFSISPCMMLNSGAAYEANDVQRCRSGALAVISSIQLYTRSTETSNLPATSLTPTGGSWFLYGE